MKTPATVPDNEEAREAQLWAIEYAERLLRAVKNVDDAAFSRAYFGLTKARAKLGFARRDAATKELEKLAKLAERESTV